MDALTLDDAPAGRFSDARPALDRRRIIAIGLSLAIEAALIWGIVMIRPDMVRRAASQALKVITIPPPPPPKAPSPTVRPDRTPTPHAAQVEHPRAAAAPAVPRPVAPPKADTVAPKPMVTVSHDAFAAMDISKLPGGGGTGGRGSGGTYGPGEGAGGTSLYPAEWYEQPSRNALDSYLTSGFHEGWAMIACKTEPEYKVDHCYGLGENPAGYGLEKALRQAAWQFRVVPPKINGKPQVGAWVRIRYDFTVMRGE